MKNSPLLIRERILFLVSLSNYNGLNVENQANRTMQRLTNFIYKHLCKWSKFFIRNISRPLDIRIHVYQQLFLLIVLYSLRTLGHRTHTVILICRVFDGIDSPEALLIFFCIYEKLFIYLKFRLLFFRLFVILWIVG